MSDGMFDFDGDSLHRDSVADGVHTDGNTTSYDHDRDGIPERVEVDANNDGRVDEIRHDADENSVYERVEVDLGGDGDGRYRDGVFDLERLDVDQDGREDVRRFDDDGDGEYDDRSFTDMDHDGVDDHHEMAHQSPDLDRVMRTGGDFIPIDPNAA